jgi:hypothetical protein
MKMNTLTALLVSASAVVAFDSASGQITQISRPRLTVAARPLPEPADTAVFQADVNGDGVLNTGDFAAFQTAFVAGDPRANCDGSTAKPVLNVGDFTCFLRSFATAQAAARPTPALPSTTNANGSPTLVPASRPTLPAPGIAVATEVAASLPDVPVGTANRPVGADANGDGVLNAADFETFRAMVQNQDPQANCDGSTTPPVVNVGDFTCFLRMFAEAQAGANRPVGADANGDGVLSAADFDAFRTMVQNQDPRANCDGSTTPPVVNAGDFTCFLRMFAEARAAASRPTHTATAVP